MVFEHDDPKLTAYALGELDAAEAEAVKQRIDNDPAAAAAVADIQKVASLMGEHFAGTDEASETLDDARRQAIERRAGGGAARSMWHRLYVRIPAVAAAAVLLLTVGAVLGAALVPRRWMAPMTVSQTEQAGRDSAEYERSTARDVHLANGRYGVESPGGDPASAMPQERLNDLAERRYRQAQIPEQTKSADGERGSHRAVPGTPPAPSAAPAEPGPRADMESAADEAKRKPGGYDTYIKRGVGGPVPEPSAAQPAVPKDAPAASGTPSQPPKPRRSDVFAGGEAGEAPAELSDPSVSGSKLALRETTAMPADEAEGIKKKLGRDGGWKLADTLFQRDWRDMDSRRTEGDGLARAKRQEAQAEAREGADREGYAHIVENPFKRVLDHPLSTFSIDVDTASYANVRRLLSQGQKPPAGAVRIEEMINYFDYDYAPPAGDAEHPFAVHTAVAPCPWAPSHKLVRVALKGKVIDPADRPASNLVFLLDVSGSMGSSNKLPLVQHSMKQLLANLDERDYVSIVTYAGRSAVVLEPTCAAEKDTIAKAIDNLKSGGSTAGAAGINSAYQLASKHYLEKGVNRVILCTDGDFNVGASSDSELVKLIAEKAKSGVFLSVFGFGMGNLQDAKLEQIADKGNGTYGYIDTPAEARKVFVDEMSGTLVTIAKDVKIQVEFNPARVAGYRLIGYENRMLAAEDFNDDTKDAGEIGAGHTVTALYQVVPAADAAAVRKVMAETGSVDPLKYQSPARLTDAADSAELLTVRLRYKQPDEDKSQLLAESLADRDVKLGAADADLRFAAAVAAFGMLLRDSEYVGSYSLAGAAELASSAIPAVPEGKGAAESARRVEQRKQFMQLIEQARRVLGDR